MSSEEFFNTLKDKKVRDCIGIMHNYVEYDTGEYHKKLDKELKRLENTKIKDCFDELQKLLFF